MSFFESMSNGFNSAVFGSQNLNSMDLMFQGAAFSWGGDVARKFNDGVEITAPNGALHSFNYRTGAVGNTPPAGGRISMGGIGMGVATTAMQALPALYYEGPGAAATALVQDAAIGGALVNWGHMQSSATQRLESLRGSQAIGLGTVVGNLGPLSMRAHEGLVNRASKAFQAGNTGRARSWNAAAMGLRGSSYMARGGAGMVATAAWSAMAGDGAIGMLGTPMAAALGVRASPYMYAGVAIAGGAYMAARAGYSVLKAGHDYRQNQKSIQTSGDLMAFNTQSALTMRGRAVQAMQNSHMNSRSALGQEASFLHNPSRNYHSQYRAGY